MGLLEERAYYKPFNYPWAFEAYKTQQQNETKPEHYQHDISPLFRTLPGAARFRRLTYKQN